ncbi:hypothetical protein HGRIS_008249 [Hohenbuehelia grisea]|uniref:N-acetyltransferase domain-containing protein n=1 Tax=Hohenbuehelia grisea TaxID=104357 RepID=A0ABR3J7N4_9AGAR
MDPKLLNPSLTFIGKPSNIVKLLHITTTRTATTSDVFYPPLPKASTSWTVTVCTSARDLSSDVWEAFKTHPQQSNIMYFRALQLQGNAKKSEPGQFWIVCSSSSANNGQIIDFVLACTDGPIGQYPICIFSPHPYETLKDKNFTRPRLQGMVEELDLQTEARQRVFSVFAPHILSTMFADLWEKKTEILRVPVPYYDCRQAHCTQSTLKTGCHQQETIRLGTTVDISGIADLCYLFGQDSDPFSLDRRHAEEEATFLVNNEQVWVLVVPGEHESNSEIASIVAATRQSPTVAAITKVFTKPNWRNRSFARMLVGFVTETLLTQKEKESVVLYVGHNNCAETIYRRVGFQGSTSSGLGIHIASSNDVAPSKLVLRRTTRSDGSITVGIRVDVADSEAPQSQQPPSQVPNNLTMRSNAAMDGLLGAEMGDAAVVLDTPGRSSSTFTGGERIGSEALEVTTGSQSNTAEPANESLLTRHGTLLSAGGSAGRNAAELKLILGSSGAKLRSGALVLPRLNTSTTYPDLTSLEQAKSRARVEVDVLLESKTCVEGGYLNGRIRVQVHKRSATESPVMLAGGKLRLIGFESISSHHHRHMFFRISSLISTVAPRSSTICMPQIDDEGFALAREGDFIVPFSMHIPIDGELGRPKGMSWIHAGANIRYIAMVSVNVKDSLTNKRSIAHFYRYCEVWPRLNPSVTLAPAPAPLRATSSKSLFMGGRGLVELTATLHRLHWVAGQNCFVKLSINNETKRTIKGVNMTLLSSVVIFRPDPHLDHDAGHDRSGNAVDPDACQTSTFQREVASVHLEMGQQGTKRHASAKGWWTGVAPGEHRQFSYCVLIPPDALSIARSRFIEVAYTLRISLNAGALTTDVSVTLPIRIISFLSLDPPPSFPSALDEYTDMEERNHDFRSQSSGTSDPSFHEDARQDVNGVDRQRIRSDHLTLNPPDELGPKDCPVDHSSEEEEDDENDQDCDADDTDIQDDCDDLVQHAINSARIDTMYGTNAARFSDLYYSSTSGLEPSQRVSTQVPDANVEQGLPDASKSVADHDFMSQPGEVDDLHDKPPTTLTADARPRRPRELNGPRGPSNFAARVQEKIQAMARQELSSADDFQFPDDGITPLEQPFEPVSEPAQEIFEGKEDHSTGENDGSYFPPVPESVASAGNSRPPATTPDEAALPRKSALGTNSRVLPQPPVTALAAMNHLDGLPATGPMPPRMDARPRPLRITHTRTKSSSRSSRASTLPPHTPPAPCCALEPTTPNGSRVPRTPGAMKGGVDRAGMDMGPRGVVGAVAPGVVESPVKAKIRELEERLRAAQ